MKCREIMKKYFFVCDLPSNAQKHLFKITLGKISVVLGHPVRDPFWKAYLLTLFEQNEKFCSCSEQCAEIFDRALSMALNERAAHQRTVTAFRHVAPENKAQKLEQLKIENIQLRAVITESDPDFFKRKCRVCGCDWNHPCNDHDYWVEDNLCSACAAHRPVKGR